ncbi:MAG: sporulation integral membrane protein YtvI [Peptococcaceae bacterium]|nr:sporulation integral membrane protein YtvI [Peptococcaceae bacterium]
MYRKVILLICVAFIVLAVWILIKALFAVGATLHFLLPAMIPFIAALVFSFVMEPIIGFLNGKCRLPRGLATFITMIIVFGGVGFILTIVLIKLVAELLHLSHSLPDLAANLMAHAQGLVDNAIEIYDNLPPYISSSVEQGIASVATSIQGVVSGVVNAIVHYLSVVPGTIVLFLVSAIATYFLSRDRQKIAQMFYNFLPDTWKEKVSFIIREVLAGFGGYVRAMLIIMLITTVISIVGLYILGANYAITLGLLAGLLEILPIVGPSLIYVSWILWTLTTGDFVFAFQLTVLLCILLGTRQMFEARIVSANLGLHPLAVLIAMYFGLKLIGVIGLLAGPITLVAIQALIKAGVFDLAKSEK